MSEAAPLSFPDELLLASKGDGGYNKQLIATIGVGLHCVLPMATISSVLLGSKSLEHVAHNLMLADVELEEGMLEKAVEICSDTAKL